ncbi:MAG: P-II family nitrogen regulator [Planctomycetota bacterium]|jgi:nitrogen regulatory protein PII 2|nr:P-II family nitrogen regulator [Planctomycetota bacterium]
MKEVMAIIRTNKVNVTKRALAEVGFPAFLCRPCLGRGKKPMDTRVFNLAVKAGALPVSAAGEAMTEGDRLIPKRFFTIIVQDDQAPLIVKTIIKANQTGNPGDGRIFVLPILESHGVRTGNCSFRMTREGGEKTWA